MRKFLLTMDKSGYNVSQQYNRLVEQATNAISDLAFLLSLKEEQLPEKYLSKLFKEETLRPLIKNLFIFRELENVTLKGERQIRFLNICKLIIETIGSTSFASRLAPNTYRIISGAERRTMNAIRTLYIANPLIAKL